MAARTFPAHLIGPLTKISVKRGVTRRLHNRRISRVQLKLSLPPFGNGTGFALLSAQAPTVAYSVLRAGLAMRQFGLHPISMAVTHEGAYQLQIAKALKPGEAAELREQGHRDSLEDYILLDRVRYSLVTLTGEAFSFADLRLIRPSGAMRS